MTPIENLIEWLTKVSLPNWPWWIDAILILCVLALVPLSRLFARWNRIPSRSFIPESELTGGLPEDPDGSHRDRAFQIARRIAETSFIHRRVERLSFEGHRRVHRHVSIDLEINSDCRIIPVGLSRKDPSDKEQIGVRAFSVRCDPWGAIPLLGRRQNSMWTYYAMVTWFEMRINDALKQLSGGQAPPITLTLDEKRRLWGVVSGPYARASRIVEEVLDRQEDAETLMTSPSHDWQARLTSLGPNGRLALALLSDQALGITFSRLSTSWVILVALPDDPGRSRVVIKYDFDDFVDIEASLVPSQPNFWAGLGWGSVVAEIPTVTSLPSESLHLEFVAPVGLEVETSALVAYRAAKRRLSDGSGRTSLDTREIRRLLRTLSTGTALAPSTGILKAATDAEGARHTDVSHVYLPHLRTTLSLHALVVMRIERTPQLLSGVLGSLLLAGLLWLGSARPGPFAAAPDTIILTAPTALVGVLLFRQHSFVSRISRSLRFLLWSAVAISVIAVALTLVTDPTTSIALRNGFRFLRWPATLIAGLITPALLGARTRVRRQAQGID